MRKIMKAASYLVLAVMCAASAAGVPEWVYVTWSVICYTMLAALIYMDN